MKKYVIIVAGGKGLRMGGEIPKQFLPLNGKPILMHTIEAFFRYDSAIHCIVVLPIDQQAYWQELCQKKAFIFSHEVVDGGNTRFQSVKNGLERVVGTGLVAIHDGVRPFVAQQVIARCFDTACTKRAVIPVIKPVDTLRRMVVGDLSETVSREEYRIVQTPQVFDIDLLKQAYDQPHKPFFTDDASVVEASGNPVFLVEGNRENIKLTTPFDLKVAEILASEGSYV